MDSIDNLIREYKELEIDKQLEYEKFYLYSIITHSTAIEGSTVTEIENQLLFDEGISPRKTIQEQLMNMDLKKAYEKAFDMADKKMAITVKLLCDLSGLIMKNTGSLYNTISGNFDSSEGDLRLLNVSAGRGGKSYMAWQKVPAKLEEFCSWLNKSRGKVNPEDVETIYKLSFEAHYRLVYIHPWADGNGRMARLIMNLVQREAGVIPSIVKKEKRVEYIKSLAESQETDNIDTFLTFMMNHHIENINEQIIEYRESIVKDI